MLFPISCAVASGVYMHGFDWHVSIYLRYDIERVYIDIRVGCTQSQLSLEFIKNFSLSWYDIERAYTDITCNVYTCTYSHIVDLFLIWLVIVSDLVCHAFSFGMSCLSYCVCLASSPIYVYIYVYVLYIYIYRWHHRMCSHDRMCSIKQYSYCVCLASGVCTCFLLDLTRSYWVLLDLIGSTISFCFLLGMPFLSIPVPVSHCFWFGLSVFFSDVVLSFLLIWSVILSDFVCHVLRHVLAQVFCGPQTKHL